MWSSLVGEQVGEAELARGPREGAAWFDAGVNAGACHAEASVRMHCRRRSQLDSTRSGWLGTGRTRSGCEGRGRGCTHAEGRWGWAAGPEPGAPPAGVVNWERAGRGGDVGWVRVVTPPRAGVQVHVGAVVPCGGIETSRGLRTRVLRR